MRKALEGWEGGIVIEGKKISNLQYADDTTIFATTEKEMSELLNRIEKGSESVSFYINKAKTKIIVIDRIEQLTPTGKLSGREAVQEFVYLVLLHTNKGGYAKEIRRRMQMTKSAMNRLTRVWQDRNIKNQTKIRLVRSLIFGIFL